MYISLLTSVGTIIDIMKVAIDFQYLVVVLWQWTKYIYVYVIWMWIDWYQKYQPAEPEYEVCWWVNEANESQISYSVEQADIFQYQSYSHSDDIFIIPISTINTDTSIFVFLREKLHDSKYSKYASLKP